MISVEQLGLSQGAFHLDGLAFAVPTGMYAVLMGATGSGKTTLLEAIAGLRPVRSGRILLDGRDVTRLSPAARGLGYVPQDNTLFRTRTVFRNLSFALELRDTPQAEIERRVSEMAGWLRIEPLLGRYPAGLSGGEAQRVALGRALVFKPSLLLLDEPLSSLDDETRSQLVDILQALRQRRDVTVLHITHNRFELKHLAKDGLKVGIGNENQCALGDLTMQTFNRTGLSGKIRKNIAKEAPSGDLLISDFRAKALDVIVCYESNATPYLDEMDFVPIDIGAGNADCTNPLQPVAIAKACRYPQLARRLLDAFQTPESRAQFEKLGFGWVKKDLVP